MASLPVRFRRKVVLYATLDQSLLVFTEPDFPEAGTQVPGGTAEDDELLVDAAQREYLEETGFVAPLPILIGEAQYSYEAGGVQHEHARSFFHLTLRGDYPERWMWTEQTPDGGDSPIRMEFFFVPLSEAPELFGGLGRFLPELKQRM